MIILKDIKARGAAAPDWQEKRGIIAQLLHEVAPGAFVHVTLGHAGLMVFHGETKVGIPLDEIMRLVQEHEKELVPLVRQAQAPASTTVLPGNTHKKVTGS